MNSVRTTQFNDVRVNNPWSITRPSYRAGTAEFVPRSVPMPINNRSNTGNYNLTRKNFLAPRVKARDPVDFDKVNAVNLAQFGQKIQLSEKTLLDLTGIDMPDPLDFNWIAEFNRRKALGESEEVLKRNPPLGRQQRTIKKRINIGEATTTFGEGLQIVNKLILEGRAETLSERAILGAEISKIVANTEKLERMEQTNYIRLLRAIARIQMPSGFRDAGITQRLWDNKQYSKNQGLINLFLMSNFDVINEMRKLTGGDKLTDRKPVTGLSEKPITLRSVMSRLSDSKQYLDIHLRKMINHSTAVKLVLKGVDGGTLSGVKLELPAPEEEKKE
jgi:hypothetical protein